MFGGIKSFLVYSSTYLWKGTENCESSPRFIMEKSMLICLMQVTGELNDDLTCWDALRAALPVGTVSGASQVFIFITCFPSHFPLCFIFSSNNSKARYCQNIRLL